MAGIRQSGASRPVNACRVTRVAERRARLPAKPLAGMLTSESLVTRAVTRNPRTPNIGTASATSVMPTGELPSSCWIRTHPHGPRAPTAQICIYSFEYFVTLVAHSALFAAFAFAFVAANESSRTFRLAGQMQTAAGAFVAGVRATMPAGKFAVAFRVAKRCVRL